LDELLATVAVNDPLLQKMLDDLKANESSRPTGQCDPDDVPAPPDEAKTKRGDLWILGNHRLLR
jgi:hypothetical protein